MSLDEFRSAILEGAAELAQKTLGGFAETARADAAAFLEKAQAPLAHWTAQLAAGDLSPEDFADLLGAQQDLAKIEALAREGIVAAQIDRFRSALFELVVQSAARTIL